MPNPITSENLPKEKSEDPKTPSPETLNNTKCIFSFLEITVQHQGPAIIIELEHDDNNQDDQPNNPGDEDEDAETPTPEHNNDSQDGQPDTNKEEDAPPEQENFPPIMPKEPSNKEGDAPPPEQEIHPPFMPKEPPNENHTNNKVPAPPDKDRNTDLTLDIEALSIDDISLIQQANTNKDRNGPTIKEPPQQGRPHRNTQKRNYKEYGGGKIQKPNGKAQQSYGRASLSKALKAQTEFDQCTPKSYKQANTCDDKEEWQEAIGKELAKFLKNKVWELVPPNNLQKQNVEVYVLQGVWKFRIKTKDGRIDKFKARLCADGKQMRNQIECQELDLKEDLHLSHDNITSPSADMTTTKLFIAFAAARNLRIHSGDIPSAYLQTEIDSLKYRVYLKQPKGYIPPKGKEDWLLRLNSMMYRLINAGQVWFKVFHRALLDIGFEQSKKEPCIFKLTEGNETMWVKINTDDNLNISTCEKLQKRVVD